MLPVESPELVDQVIKAAPNHNGRAAVGMEADQSEGIGVHTSQPCFLPTTSRGVIPSNRRLSVRFLHHPSSSLRHVVPRSCALFSIPEIFFPRIVARGRFLPAQPSERHRVWAVYRRSAL
ncbi:hypothetical protein CI102_11357 [Trichoderma harzianum]|uniref:Uncharacterized protein n=1 Tax=Trichoderma harzianum CBS 226.95 TaxID=983964 RepID=A0A2T4AIZ0_TRIHA|nr:hypothetical protein M431DRAFT_392623 [Trichoderma harzianum CBS 226.95]PKK44568.1 hypothetical protein CI102_11357 [Trichoderma harzianum]PTB57023.1 hypothetical protein M431DRAFT_392623 [Trichoderma harzianum CBS 226.95]